MFKYIKSLFVKQPKKEKKFIVTFKGQIFFTGNSKEKLEKQIYNAFLIHTNSHTIPVLNNSYKLSERYKLFRSYFKITEVCTTCGHKSGYCGQC
jgi:phenylpropionate dioxygenase-like ring-hydroxylating dioxygenase large terminal subunit